MPIGSFGNAMHSTRMRMLTHEVDRIADEFALRFGMSVGDVVEMRRCNSAGREYWVAARIAEAECCYFNQRGGWTAFVKVFPINVDGTLGCSRRARMTTTVRGKFVGDLDDFNQIRRPQSPQVGRSTVPQFV